YSSANRIGRRLGNRVRPGHVCGAGLSARMANTMRTFKRSDAYRSRHVDTTINRNFVAKHFIRKDKGYECKYCDYRYIRRDREDMLLHLVKVHHVGFSSTVRG